MEKIVGGEQLNRPSSMLPNMMDDVVPSEDATIGHISGPDQRLQPGKMMSGWLNKVPKLVSPTSREVNVRVQRAREALSWTSKKHERRNAVEARKCEEPTTPSKRGRHRHHEEQEASFGDVPDEKSDKSKGTIIEGRQHTRHASRIHLGSRATVLILQLDSAEVYKRYHAAEALATMGPNGAIARRALETALLNDSSVHVRKSAAFALGNIGDREAMAVLDIAASDDEDKFVRLNAQQAALKLRSHRSA